MGFVIFLIFLACTVVFLLIGITLVYVSEKLIGKFMTWWLSHDKVGGGEDG